MELRDTPEEASFRGDLRAWLEENVPGELRGHRGGAARFDGPEMRAWSRALYDAGYAGLTWPEEYGGGGAPYTHQAIFLEEIARAEAPTHIGVIGLGMAGPTIMAHGTEEHKARYLAPILSAEEIWCQGFSEPGAGSDLAGVRTSSRLEDGHFVIDGQKVWSSFAHLADWCILLTRSDPESTRHAGLTYLIVDMHAPGVEVRPLTQITGEAEFNEIFFTGVRVPTDNLLGEVGGGWQVAMTTLLHERGTLGFALQAAREWIEMEAVRFTNYRSLSALMKTGLPGPEGSISKLVWSEANQRVTKLALEILGPDAALAEGNAPYGGYWQYQQLRSRGNTIEAGTSEVLRNIVAERVLGLPKSR
ncbi:MAG: acyl-CoA dehydrogenase [Thermoleophilia bacterium]|nr:acyl-CoA dehydrogenase [Thermoleophilia bacterium]